MDEYWKEQERRAWQSYENGKTLYHVTPAKSALAIQVGGIVSHSTVDDEPAIWFFTEKDWAAEVAQSIGMHEYALFSIRKSAIKRELIRWDNVGELYAAVSFYCIKKHIPRSYVSLVGCYRIRQEEIASLTIPSVTGATTSAGGQ